MKFYDIDFAALLKHVETWDRLERSSRAMLLRLKSTEGTPGARFGDDLELLVSKKLLTRYADDVRVRLHEGFRDSAKALRAMDRSPIATEPTQDALRHYLTENFTAGERERIVEARHRWHDPLTGLVALVSSTSHVTGFLETKDALAWEAARMPAREPWLSPRQLAVRAPLLGDAKSVRDLRALLGTLAAQPAPVPFSELRERLKKLSGPRLGHAILAGVRYMLCFPVMTESTLEPQLTLWPTVAQRLCRGAASKPQAVEPEESSLSAWAAEDVTQFLITAAEPLRLRGNDMHLFAKAQRAAEDALLPLPSWLSGTQVAYERSGRVSWALALALHCDLVQVVGTTGKNLRVELTDGGRAWLARPARERLASLLDSFRPGGQSIRPDEEWDDDLDRVSSSSSPYYGFLPDVGLCINQEAQVEAENAVVAACSTLQLGRPVSLNAFVSHGSEVTNPLFEPDSPIFESLSSPWRRPSVEELEEHWAHQLRSFIVLRLVPFGGARLGLLQDSLSIELTETGRYLLGLRDELPADALADPDSEQCPVRIQPDFEVLFLAPAPAIEASFARFSERIGHRVGALFRITRPSILAAARAGLARDEVLDTLRSSSPQPPPPNVEHEIGAWFDECRTLQLESALVIRCPDTDTAHRLQSAAGRHLEPLSDTVFLLPAPAQRTKLIQVCKKAGIFLEGGEPERAKKKKRKAKRRRYW